MAYHKTSHLPSVTQILAPFVDYSRVPAHILEQASERGTRVHQACACKLLGVWSLPVPPELSGYIKSFEGWARNISDVILVEEELVDAAHGYCGHPDWLVRLKGDQHNIGIDCKTPASTMPTWRCQLAAYGGLFEANGHEVSRLASLRLRKDGGQAKLDEYTGSRGADFAVFLSALNCWRYFRSEGK